MSKVNKAIAREGLTILGLLAISFLLIFVIPQLAVIGLFILIFGYPAYLIFHFVLWAVKTLWGVDSVNKFYISLEKKTVGLNFCNCINKPHLCFSQ